jgi:MraZ protein
MGVQARRVIGVFQGSSKLSLDNRGRMVVPTKYRDTLQAESEGKLTLTRSRDGCLYLMPRTVWLIKREEIVGWGMEFVIDKRLYLGSASDVDMDSAGRVLIAPELRDAASLPLDAKVMLVGMGSHFEVWEAGAYEASLAAPVVAAVPPPPKFSF